MKPAVPDEGEIKSPAAEYRLCFNINGTGKEDGKQNISKK
jgi:hypothetical protein